jgi:hypothetical protein
MVQIECIGAEGGFEKPFQRILNDLQGLGRSVSSLAQYKALLTDCKRTVDICEPPHVPKSSKCCLP